VSEVFEKVQNIRDSLTRSISGRNRQFVGAAGSQSRIKTDQQTTEEEREAAEELKHTARHTANLCTFLSSGTKRRFKDTVLMTSDLRMRAGNQNHELRGFTPVSLLRHHR